MATQFRVPVLETFPWQQQVLSQGLNTPPASPSKGNRYIVGTSPTGAWNTHGNAIAWYDGAAWQFDAPTAGWTSYSIADSKEYLYNGTAWVSADVSSKADKVSGATAGNIAQLDSSGNLVDSGISASSLSLAISKSHTQNTDQYVDFGGANQTSAAQIHTAATNSHVQGTDQFLDQGGANQVSASQAKTAYDSRAIYDSGLQVLTFTI